MILTLLKAFGFALAFGGGMATLALMARARANTDAAIHLRSAIRPMATMGLAAIALPWITGIPMWIDRHGATMDLAEAGI